jgi:hypothetical protein
MLLGSSMGRQLPVVSSKAKSATSLKRIFTTRCSMRVLIEFREDAFIYEDLDAQLKLIKKLCSIKSEFILIDF